MIPRYGVRTIGKIAPLALLTTLALTGCDGRGTNVTGTIRYRGQPLTSGTVSFFCENGEIHSSLLSEEGSYQLPRLPPGSARVAVVSHPRIPQGLQTNQGPPSPAPLISAKGRIPQKPQMRVPERYGRPESSGLLFTINPGDQ